jgi:Family of unknown function (DUF5689)
MRKLLLLLGFSLLIFSEKINAQTLIAGWDFQTAPGTVVLASTNTPKLYNSNVGSGILYLDGTNGASNWSQMTELNAFGGTALNAGGSTGLSTTTTSPSCLALIGGTSNSANGKILVFKVNMAAYQNLIITYATQKTASGFATQTWEYSTNGTTWLPVSTISSIPTSFAVQTLSTITGLNGIANAFVRLTVTGATNSTGNNRLDNIQFNATLVPIPTLTATPTTIPAFNYVLGNGPSTAGSYTLSGSILTPTAGDITITAPTDFEVSTTSATTGFANNLLVPYTGGTLANTTIYTRLKAGLAISSSYMGNVTHTGGGVTTPPTVALSGSVTSVAPPVITTTGTLSPFYTIVGTPSTPQSYTITGNDLVSDITITAPTNFEIKTGAGAYANTLMLTQSSGSVSTTTIDVRLKGTTVGSFTGQNITNVSTTASANIALNGTVGASCGVATNIATVRALVPPVASNTGGTTNYTVTGTITGVFGASKFYVQDATGGIAVFSTNVVSLNSLAVGDQVTLSGIPVRFNGEAQLNGPILTTTPSLTRDVIPCITKISTGTAPAPIVFNANTPPSGIDLNTFLASNEGAFIKIISANIPSVGTFVASTNYTVISCNTQGGTEIRVDAGATTLIGSTIPTVTQDITAVVGRFVNATGTDKLQIFPRSASDLSNSGTTCTVSGGCGVTSFTDSPTQLDIFNWNIEWLGHPTNGPSQSGTLDATQIANARTVLNSVGADVYMLQEICQYNPVTPTDNTTAFGKLIEGLNNTFGANTYSGECSSAVSSSVVDPNAQRVCIIYKNSVVTKIFSRPMFDGFTPSSYPPTGTPSQFWASGRKPFMFMAKVNINSQPDTILFVGLHAKAGSAIDDYNRRKFDVRVMYDTLQAQYPTRKTIVLGDLNDDTDKSIASNATNGQLISSYAPFLYVNPNETAIAGTRPNADWNPISKTLSDSFCASTATFSDYIDHQIVSNEMSGTTGSGFKYVPASVTSFRPVVANYASTTSDHYPTIARYQYITSVYETTTTGDWNVGTTWVGGNVPPTTADVIIKHNVTIPNTYTANAKNIKLDNGGTLTLVGTGAIGLN